MSSNEGDYKKDNFKSVNSKDLIDIKKFNTDRSNILKSFRDLERIPSDDVNGKLELTEDDINGYLNMNNLNINSVEIEKGFRVDTFTENLILTNNVGNSKDFITSQIDYLSNLNDLDSVQFPVKVEVFDNKTKNYKNVEVIKTVPLNNDCYYSKDISLINEFEVVFKNMVNAPGSNWREVLKAQKFKRLTKHVRVEGSNFFKVMISNKILVPPNVETIPFDSKTDQYYDNLKEFYGSLSSVDTFVCIESSFRHQMIDDSGRDVERMIDMFLINNKYERDVTASESEFYSFINDKLIKDNTNSSIVKPLPNPLDKQNDIINMKRYQPMEDEKRKIYTKSVITNLKTVEPTRGRRKPKGTSSLKQATIDNYFTSQRKFIDVDAPEYINKVDRSRFSNGKRIELKEVKIIYFINDVENTGYLYIRENGQVYYYNKETYLLTEYDLPGLLFMYKFN